MSGREDRPTDCRCGHCQTPPGALPPAPPEGERRACAVCGRELDYLARRVGQGGWLHRPHDADDHLVVPVPVEAVAAFERCDFCCTDEVRWIVPAGTLDGEPGISDRDGAWSACTPCALLVATNQWSALHRRVIEGYVATGSVPPGKTVDQLSAELDTLWRWLRPNITGEPVQR